MDGFIQMMNTITLDFGYMPVEFRRDRGVQSVLLPEDSFGWHYSQTYLGKDYVEGLAAELKPSLVSLNQPKQFKRCKRTTTLVESFYPYSKLDQIF